MIRITIEGAGGEGKTTLLHLIAWTLKRVGQSVTAIDEGTPVPVQQTELPLLDRRKVIVETEAGSSSASDFAEMVRRELIGARAANGNMNSAHEAHSVILEEVEEFWDEVKLKRHLRSQANMLKELVQVAAMAQRAAEDLGLVEDAKLAA